MILAHLFSHWSIPSRRTSVTLTSSFQYSYQTLKKHSANDRQAESRTLIDMSLSVRSLDLDFATGTFKLSGWMKLAWRDDRQMPPYPPPENKCFKSHLDNYQLNLRIKEREWGREISSPFSTSLNDGHQ
jgi:hypothetical protein